MGDDTAEMSSGDDTAASAAAEPLENKTIKLRKPVKVGDLEFATIDLREPTAAELARASKQGKDSGVDQVIQLVSIVGNVPAKAVGQLCQRDFQECADFLASFGDTNPGSAKT